jgi:hypothetical protein
MTPKKLEDIQTALRMNGVEMARGLLITPKTYSLWLRQASFDGRLATNIHQRVRGMVRDQLLTLNMINDELEKG